MGSVEGSSGPVYIQYRWSRMSETVKLRNTSVRGRRSIYSRYVKEHLFGFLKQKENNPKNMKEKSTFIKTNKVTIEETLLYQEVAEEYKNSHTAMITRPPPVPVPAPRKPPFSATAFQSRTLSELDAALKEFKLSTAASRKSLKQSQIDLSEIEESVEIMIRSRPCTPVPEI